MNYLSAMAKKNTRKNKNRIVIEVSPFEGTRTIRLLQIGDVHYPQWDEVPKDLDQKDKGLTQSFTQSIARDPIQTVLRDIAQRVHYEKYDAVALMGDLTSFGDLEGYQRVLSQLTAIIDVEHQTKLKRASVLVPGNHDISRSLALNASSDNKFQPLLAMLSSNGWPAFPIHQLVSQALPAVSPVAQIFPLNTCLGCGEKRRMPEATQRQVEELSKRASGASLSKEEAEQLFEQLDTPALDEKVIEALAKKVSELKAGVLPILVAHHNLLPQAIPRLAPYTELINSGQLRRQLLRTDKAVLYLHGHIHEDPIEIISDPSFPNGKLVCISAPELRQGFNDIMIYSSPSRGVIGCRITPIRFRAGQGLSKDKPIDIGLCKAQEITSPLAYKIVQVMSERRSPFFDEVFSAIAQEDEYSHLTANEVANVILEMHFANMLTIGNPAAPYADWRLRM